MNIITGMHRSGTSLVAKILYKSGADFGNPQTFYRPDKWNTEGYYEQPEIFQINRALLHGFWGKLSYFFLPKEQTILKRSKKHRNRIQNLYKNYKSKFVKDPRFCLTLPAWLSSGATIEKLVVVLREPIQVAYSLKRRNHISLELGLKLWYEHNKRILNYIENIPHIFLFYNRILDNEKSFDELKKMLDFFYINKEDVEIAQLIEQNIKLNMNHHKDKTFYEYPVHIRRLWEKILENS